MAITREMSKELRDAALYQGKEVPDCRTLSMCVAETIDALLDAIEAGGMVQPRPAPVMDLGPLRELRQWHLNWMRERPRFTDLHREAVSKLNLYFPQDDQL